jgi:hypothetical protein
MTNINDKYEVPALARFLLQRCLPVYSREGLLGDLNEEHAARATVDPSSATRWYWYQTLRTLLYVMSSVLGSIALLRVLVLALSFLLLPTLISMVAWLSNMNETSPEIMEYLLAGQMHNMLGDSYFWQQQLSAVGHIDFEMYLNVPSVLWAACCLFVLFYTQKKHPLSAHQIAAFGYGLMLLPYFVGLIYIDSMQLVPTKIGPIIAFMLISIVYLLGPIAYLILQQLNKQKLAMTYE